jgi:hypothetical protein
VPTRPMPCRERHDIDLLRRDLAAGGDVRMNAGELGE